MALNYFKAEKEYFYEKQGFSEFPIEEIRCEFGIEKKEGKWKKNPNPFNFS